MSDTTTAKPLEEITPERREEIRQVFANTAAKHKGKKPGAAKKYRVQLNHLQALGGEPLEDPNPNGPADRLVVVTAGQMAKLTEQAAPAATPQPDVAAAAKPAAGNTAPPAKPAAGK